MKTATAFLALALCFAAPAFADGMALKRGPLMESWSLLGEKAQSAIVLFHKGREALLLAIDLEEDIQGGSAVWIFPIPSGPAEAKIDILTKGLDFHGFDIEARFRSELLDMSIALGLFSTFPLSIPAAYFAVLSYPRGGFYDSHSLGGLHSKGPSERGVTIHQSVAKMGLTSELVTTKDRNALGRYLSEKGLDLQDTSLAILDWYVGREYTFVVSYASESVASGLSVFVSFPTDKIYFPLKLTSVYGSRRIPISLLVKGHVRPNLAAKIRRGSSVKYLAGTYEFTRRIPEPFWRGGTYFVDFTRIEIDTASKNLHDDLWMRDSPPLRIRLLRLPSWFTAALVIFSYAAFSMLASWAAGRVSFKEDPPPAWKLLLVGLANFLTMLVFIPTALASQKKGRRRDFILRFYLYFLGLLGGGTGLLWLWYS